MTDFELLKNLKTELEAEFLQDLVPYWMKYALYEKNGGFVGRVTFNNQKVYDSEKGGILNARLLWAFSAACKKYPIPEIEDAAHRAFHYLIDHFVDNEYGGLYWILDAKGGVVDDRKHIYAQAFGVYGLVEYYSAFKDRKALKLAYNIFHLIEKHARDDKNGGYFESYNRKWELNRDVRLSDKDENEPKSMNTHLHILEAYTNLYRFAPNKELKERLRALIRIFCDHIITSDQSSLVNFMDVDWSPRSDTISYGHNIETSWLLLEAAEVLEDSSLIESVKECAVSLADAVMISGIDSDGALLNEINSKGISDSDKDWWPQAEAIIGFLNAYQIKGDRKYLQAAWNSWEFIKSFIIDRKYGEWFEKVSRDGAPYDKLDKVRSWKAPYHNFRAVLEVQQRVAKLEIPGQEELVEVKINS
ncbi:MAG: AGE family epimerase/isomerase [Balneolaceae bacterium]